MKITAAVTESAHAPFVLQELELGDLRPDEVLVRVAAAGICHTDLIMRDQWYPVPLPAVLGHEGAGVVERVGSAVTLVAPGERVGMSFDSCGHCPTCRTGRPAYCHDFWALQLRRDARRRHERALARRRAHPRALLRAVELRHARRRQRAQRRHAAGLDPARDRGALRLRHPDRRRRRARRAARSGRQHAGRLRHRRGRALGDHGRRRSRAARRSSASTATPRASSWRASSARRTSSTPPERDAPEEIRRITGFGVDFSVETTGVPALLRAGGRLPRPAGHLRRRSAPRRWAPRCRST